MLPEQLLEAQNERICLHLPVEEAHQTLVEEVTAVARVLRQPCRIVSAPEEVGGRPFSEPVAREVRPLVIGHQMAEEAAVGVLESFFHRYRWRIALALEEVVVWIEVERPSAALPLRSLQ